MKAGPLNRLRSTIARRGKKASFPQDVALATNRHIQLVRIPAQMRNGGIYPGRYGEEMRKWGPNMPSTIKGKGHSKVLFSTLSTSRLLSGLTVRSVVRRGGPRRAATVVTRIVSSAKYSIHIDKGRKGMVPRPIFKTYKGDAKWQAAWVSRERARA